MKPRVSSVPSTYVDPWDIMNNFCFHVYAQKWHICEMSSVNCQMSNAYVDPWDMLNNFCLLYAQMSLFMGENDKAYFTTATTVPFPVSGPIIELVPS